jgi:tetratricopeptide (TPR) repeat protein
MVTSAVIQHKEKDYGHPSKCELMVKKIRRRVEKEAVDEENGAQVAFEAENADSEGFVADIEQFAEDQFTRGIVDGLKVLYTNRKLIGIGTVVILAGFAFMELGDVTQQEEVSESAQILAKGLKSLETARGGDSQAGEAATEVSAKEREVGLTRAAREFEQLKGNALLGAGGLAAAQFGLGDYKTAAASYRKAATAANTDLMLKASAISGEAAALEDAGDLAGAGKSWATLAQIDQSRFGALAAVQQARLLMAANKPEAAQKIISGVDTLALSPFGLKPKIEQLKGLLPTPKK